MSEHCISVAVLRKSYGRFLEQDIEFQPTDTLKDIHDFFKAAYGDDFISFRVIMD